MRWLLLLCFACAAEAGAPRFVVENTDPELMDFAKEMPAFCELWFQKIREILYGANAPEAPAEVRIVIGGGAGVGRTEGNVIYLSAREAKRKARLDFRAVVVHELVHVAQGYAVPARCDGMRILGCLATGKFYAPTWISEGIADYVTYTHYTGTNARVLQLTSEGQLRGYDESIPYLFWLQEANVSVDAKNRGRGVEAGKGYQHGYTVTGAFFWWLEETKDRKIVGKLNASVREKTYSGQFWRQHCGATVDVLWKEFVVASQRGARSGGAQVPQKVL